MFKLLASASALSVAIGGAAPAIVRGGGDESQPRGTLSEDDGPCDESFPLALSSSAPPPRPHRGDSMARNEERLRDGRRMVAVPDDDTGRSYAPLCDDGLRVDVRRRAQCAGGSCFNEWMQQCTFECTWNPPTPQNAMFASPSVEPTSDELNPPSIFATSEDHYCGQDWMVASTSCSDPCPGGLDSECAPGERCFGYTGCAQKLASSTAWPTGQPTVSPRPTITSAPTSSAPSTDAEDHYCGRSWMVASRTCNNPCPGGDASTECAQGEQCFTSTGCANKLANPTVVPTMPRPEVAPWPTSLYSSDPTITPRPQPSIHPIYASGAVHYPTPEPMTGQPTVTAWPSPDPTIPSSIFQGFVCDIPSRGCINGMFNQALCECECIPPFCQDANGDCTNPSNGCGGNPWTQCTRGANCPWWVNPLQAESCTTGPNVPRGIWSVYNTRAACCNTNFPYSNLCNVKDASPGPTKHPTIAIPPPEVYEVVPIKFVVRGLPPADVPMRELKDEMRTVLKRVMLVLSKRIPDLKISSVEEKNVLSADVEPAMLSPTLNPTGRFGCNLCRPGQYGANANVIFNGEVSTCMEIYNWFLENYQEGSGGCRDGEARLSETCCRDGLPVKRPTSPPFVVAAPKLAPEGDEQPAEPVSDPNLEEAPSDAKNLRKVAPLPRAQTDEVTLYYNVFVVRDESKRFGPMIIQELRNSYDEVVAKIRTYTDLKYLHGEDLDFDWCTSQNGAFSLCAKQAIGDTDTSATDPTSMPGPTGFASLEPTITPEPTSSIVKEPTAVVEASTMKPTTLKGGHGKWPTALPTSKEFTVFHTSKEPSVSMTPGNATFLPAEPIVQDSSKEPTRAPTNGPVPSVLTEEVDKNPTMSPFELAAESNVYYPNFSNGVCLNDGNIPHDVSEKYLFQNATECCKTYFSANMEACLEARSPTASPTPLGAKEWYPDYDNDACKNDGRQGRFEINFFYSNEKCCEFVFIDTEKCLEAMDDKDEDIVDDEAVDFSGSDANKHGTSALVYLMSISMVMLFLCS